MIENHEMIDKQIKNHNETNQSKNTHTPQEQTEQSNQVNFLVKKNSFSFMIYSVSYMCNAY